MMHMEHIKSTVKSNLKNSLLESGLCDYSDAQILVKGTVSIAAQAGDNPNNEDKEQAFKNCAPFTDCIVK